MDAETPSTPEFNAKAARELGGKILERIKAAEKRESEWVKDAEAAEAAYSGSSKDAPDAKVYDFNILHSNVETIVPAIYNSTPVPDIRPRRVEAVGSEPVPPQPQAEGVPPDPVAMQQFEQQAQMFAAKKQRDKDSKEYGRLLERSIAIQIDDNRLDAEVEGAAQDAFLAGRGVIRLRLETDSGPDGSVSNERLTFEAVSWRDYREGPASRWANVPWVAFRVPMDRETFERFSDAEQVKAQEAIKPTEQPLLGDEAPDTIYHWEYWDKIDRKVYFVREDDGVIVKQSDDPLGLPDFFPCAQPIQPITLTGKRVPVCPFTVYRALAEELDTITKRIKKIVSGMKVRGVVAGNASTMSKLAEANDNEILVESELEQLVQTGGLDKAIAWWPIEPAAKVLAQLYAQREQIKAAIYEITGISDIVRGASNAGETATAQQIKTQWGSLRIQKMQRLIERQIRDIFVKAAHLISTKFQPETLVAMTGIELTEGIQQLMASPADANYRVNVESNSTVRADLTNQKQEMNEFLAGTASFFSSIGPLVQQQPMAAEPMAEIYSSAARNFRLGKQAEDALDAFVAMAKQAAKQPPPNPEAEKAKADAEINQQKLQLDGAKLQLEERKLGIEEQRLTMDQTNGDREHNFRLAESKLKEGEDGEIEQDDRKEEAFAQALMQGLQMLAGSIQQGNAQLAQLIQAPRQTQLIVGPDGKKTAISTSMTVN